MSAASRSLCCENLIGDLEVQNLNSLGTMSQQQQARTTQNEMLTDFASIIVGTEQLALKCEHRAGTV